MTQGVVIGKGSVLVLTLTLVFSLVSNSFAQETLNGGGPPGSGLTDSQITGIIFTADQLAIETGKFAKSRVKDKEVRRFVDQMIADHLSATMEMNSLVTKLKDAPEPSEASKSLKLGAEESLTELKKKKKGKTFDQTYIANEVSYHEAVLDTIDNKLIPHAKNEELKNMLEEMRPEIQAHLDRAKKIQKHLNRKS